MASPLGAALWRGPVSCAWAGQKKHQCFQSGKEGGLPYVISRLLGGGGIIGVSHSSVHLSAMAKPV